MNMNYSGEFSVLNRDDFFVFFLAMLVGSLNYNRYQK